MLIVIAIITAIVMQARIQAKTHIVTAIVMQARIQARTHIITAIVMQARIQAKTHIVTVIVILTIKRINRNVTVDSGKMQHKNDAEITHMVWKPYGFSSYNIVKK